MSEELLINATAYEHRVALLDKGVLQEIYIERVQEKGLVGNIYKGKVVRILPGMQAAFIEIGLKKAAFLHISDMGIMDVNQPISQVLNDGQSIIVQVIKDAFGNKGARLSTSLSIPARYLVFMPGSPFFVGVSQRIEDESERDRLKALLQAHLNGSESGGYIIRTVAQGVESFEKDKKYLEKQWELIQKRANDATIGTLLHEDLPLPLRALRDLVKAKTEQIFFDNDMIFAQALTFVRHFIPEIEGKLALYNHVRPMFDLYGVEDEIERALARKVYLKSGGYLVFDQTEAMTTIDINTGGFVGYNNVDDTIFRTNLEAAHTIARQIRLRNLGGIIIIDFIDMLDPAHRRQVLRTLEKALAQDNTKTNISDISSLGLVQMTRKRTRESLQHQLCEICLSCGGRGMIKSAETLSHEIFRAIARVGITHDSHTLLVLAAQPVIDRLLGECAEILSTLEDTIKKTIKCQVENLYQQEQYDVVLL
jgi:ribonuclease G